jgi:hypothetical protein
VLGVPVGGMVTGAPVGDDVGNGVMGEDVAGELVAAAYTASEISYDPRLPYAENRVRPRNDSDDSAP